MKSELRRLFALALPLAIAEAGTQVMSVVDMAVVGRLGGRELAACGLANAVYFGVSVFGLGLMLGIDPLISQAIGAGGAARARHVLWQGVWLSLIASALLVSILLFGPFLLTLIGVKRELIQPATAYLLVRLIGIAPWMMFFVLRAYLQAHHITRPMVTSMVLGNVLNFAGDVFLVFTMRLGVVGAAISTVTCQFLALAVLAVAVMRIEVPAFSRAWQWPEIRRAIRVGLPTAFQVTAEVGIFALVALIAGRLGTVDLAAHQLVITLASFTFTVALGVATAGSVRVGLAVGARDRQGARRAGFATFIGAAIVMAVSAIAFMTVPRALARMLTNQQEVIAAALPLFFVAALFQLSDGLQAAGIGALRGAADTKFAFITNVIGYWLIGLPVGLLLGFKMEMGVVGFWWGFVAGLTCVAVMVFLRFEYLSGREIVPVVDKMNFEARSSN